MKQVLGASFENAGAKVYYRETALNEALISLVNTFEVEQPCVSVSSPNSILSTCLASMLPCVDLTDRL